MIGRIRRLVASLAIAALATAWAGTAAGAQEATEQAAAPAASEQADAPVVRMARATWDTGWFQAEIYRQLLQQIGYRVEGPTTMENEEFFTAVNEGEVDLWANGWFPLHQPLLDDATAAEPVGVQVEGGALQGYLVDKATAEEHDITNLGDLANPEIAELFDRDGDGRADLIGCNTGWTCGPIIDHQLDAYELTATVEQVQADYSPMMEATVERYQTGQPVLFYTFTPNWTVGRLVPGTDVVWLETPFPSLPDDQAAADEQTAVPDVPGCGSDPCQMGWPANDIRPVANTAFLDANPTVRALLDQIRIPLADILEQNARMVDGEGDPADIRRDATQWIADNQGDVSDWVNEAAPDAVPISDDGDGAGSANGTLRVAARTLPPLLTYDDGAYSGFDVELAELIAARLGMDTEFYAADTVAKQIDDVQRGVADIGLGGVAITEDRESEVDFSLPVLLTGLTILVPNDAEQGLWGSITHFVSTLLASDLPWLIAVVGVAVLVAAHMIWWFERRDNPDFAKSYRRGIWDSFYWSVVTMSTVGYGDKVARGTVGRWVALLWIAAGTLVFASFTAAIASALAVDELRSDIAGPADLVGARVATVTDSAGEFALAELGIGPVLVSEIDEAYTMLDEGKVDAVVYDAPVLQFHASREGAGAVRTVGTEFERVLYGVVIAPDNADLREQSNRALLELFESGVYGQLHDKWFGKLTE